jgi:hypothetical protein
VPPPSRAPSTRRRARKQRTAATSIPATIRYDPTTGERVERGGDRLAADAHHAIVAGVARQQRQGGKQATGQQQDAGDLATAVVASVSSGRLGRLDLGRHAGPRF